MDIKTKIKTGRLPQGYELKRSDVGKELDALYGMGDVLLGDVGKRVYYQRDFDGLQMENVAQRDSRKMKRRRR